MALRERRRLKLAQRQLLLAQIARREARYALASAIAEEQRSAGVEARSRELLADYSRRAAPVSEPSEGQALRENFAFVGSLGAMAESAGLTHRSAADLARRQAGTLAAAETRMERHESRVANAAQALATLHERREAAAELAVVPGMARKLQSDVRTHSSRFSPGIPVNSLRTQP